MRPVMSYKSIRALTDSGETNSKRSFSVNGLGYSFNVKLLERGQMAPESNSSTCFLKDG